MAKIKQDFNKYQTLTPKAILSFPSLFKLNDFKGRERYEATFVFDEDAQQTKEFKRIKSYCKKVFIEHFGEEEWDDRTGRPRTKKDGTPIYKYPFKDGDDTVYEAYQGCIYFPTSTIRKPGVVDENLDDIIDPDKIYAGCFVRALVSPYAYDNVSKGIAIGLRHVQFLSDGDEIGGGTGTPVEDAFNDVYIGDEDEDEDEVVEKKTKPKKKKKVVKKVVIEDDDDDDDDDDEVVVKKSKKKKKLIIEEVDDDDDDMPTDNDADDDDDD